MNFDELPLSKAQQRRKRKPKAVAEVYSQYPPYDGNEAQLQGQIDDMLSALGMWFFRIPDFFFKWIKMKAPVGIQKYFFGMFGGIPDTLMFERVSEKYMLCAPVELKSAKGALHGKQKHWENRGIAVQVSRSPDQNIDIVRQFQADAAIVKGLFEAQQLNRGG